MKMEEKNKINNEELKQVAGGDGTPKPDRRGDSGICPVCGRGNMISGTNHTVYDPVRGENWTFWFWRCHACNIKFITDYVTGEYSDHVPWTG